MDLSLCECGRKQSASMPRDNIDKILDKIYDRRAQEYEKGPRPVPKAILRKYQAYLPKPPPPKLRAVKTLLNKRPWGQGKQRARLSQYAKLQQDWTEEEEMEWYPHKE